MSSSSFAAFLACAALQAPAAAPQDPVPQDPVAEVIGNVRAQPLGHGTVGDLALPEPFLRRFADRIVRSSFEERFRVVIDDTGMPPAKDPVVARAPASSTAQVPPASDSSGSSTSTLRIAVGIACGAALVWLVVRGRKRS